MKKILLISFSCFLASWLSAQQDAQYTQFMFNRLGFNPAFAGTEGNKICITGLFRSQWLGFGGGGSIGNLIAPPQGSSPVTFLGSIHSPIGSHIGVGLNISNDKIGFMNALNPMLSVSYRYTFQNNDVISAGVAGGITQLSLDGGKLRAQDPGDPKVPTTSVGDIKPDFNFGLYYTKQQLWLLNDVYAGISATHLNQAKIDYTVATVQMRMHYYFTTGATYQVSAPLSIEPNLLVKYDKTKVTTDINVMATYNGKIRGGLTYRTIDAIGILAGYKITPEWQLGLAYDLTTSKISDFSNGSFELMMKYCFSPHIEPKPDKPPIPRLTPRFL
jgi:type IX secretion system PorP/SprF family membrane protein